MPDDENSQIPDPVPVTPKKETVRITLPPKPMEMNALKRETVRIGSTEAGTNGPKKETTRLPAISTAASMSSPASATQPLSPPPPGVIKPLGGPGKAPLAPTSPLKAPGSIPPRPPAFGVKPSLGLRPPGAAPAPASPTGVLPTPPPAAAGAPAEIATAKPASTAPKKETARIQVPPQPKPMVPKATVRMVPPPQPQPPVAPALVPVPTLEADDEESVVSDPILLPLSIAALVVSLATLALSYLAWAA